MSEPAAEYVRPPSADASADWLGVTDAARILGISRDAVRKRIQRGTLPARKAGRSWLVQVDASRTVLDESAEESAHVQDLRAEIAFLRRRVEQLEDALIRKAERPWWRFWR